MRNFEDKIYSEGTIEEIEELAKILREKLPHGTFPPVEGSGAGRNILLNAKINSTPEGKKTIKIEYLMKEKDRRKINIPAPATYFELIGQQKINFSYENVDYEITLLSEIPL